MGEWARLSFNCLHRASPLYPSPAQYCWFFALQFLFTWVLILFGSGINLSFFRRTDYSFQFVFYLREWQQGAPGSACNGCCCCAVWEEPGLTRLGEASSQHLLPPPTPCRSVDQLPGGLCLPAVRAVPLLQDG